MQDLAEQDNFLTQFLDRVNELGGRITAANREGAGAVLTLVFPKSGGDRIHDSGRVWLSSAPIRGRVFLRVCILSHRTRGGRVEELAAIIRDALTA